VGVKVFPLAIKEEPVLKRIFVLSINPELKVANDENILLPVHTFVPEKVGKLETLD
jgi:hypothetical protein